MTGPTNTSRTILTAIVLLPLASCERSADYEAHKHSQVEAATGSMLGPTQNTSDTLNSQLVSGSIVSPGAGAKK